jgi:hypothetical protein
MPSHRIVAFLAGIVQAATLHPDGDHVQLSAVMHAARLRIQIDPLHASARITHTFKGSRPSPHRPSLSLNGAELDPSALHSAFITQIAKNLETAGNFGYVDARIAKST